MTFPCNSFVLELDDAELTAIIRQSTAKRISEKRVTYLGKPSAGGEFNK